jgi:hypothetical protein
LREGLNKKRGKKGNYKKKTLILIVINLSWQLSKTYKERESRKKTHS